MPGRVLKVVKSKAMVKKEESLLPTVFVTYDRDAHAGYTFLKEFDQQRSVQLSFSEREYEESVFIDVVNVGGYIDSSTQSEIEYAKARGKGIRYQCDVGE